MARVVILGAGISGHTAALVLRRRLSREHEVLVVTPNRQWNWIPSNIWVGVGLMKKEDVMKPNEGSIDRIVRVLLGSVLLSLVFSGPQTWLGLIGIVPLLTGVVGFCPLYRVLGISTRAAKA